MSTDGFFAPGDSPDEPRRLADVAAQSSTTDEADTLSTSEPEVKAVDPDDPRFFAHTGTKSGDSLLMVTSGWNLITGFEDFLQTSGLNPEQVYTGISVVPPVPLWADEQRDRWPWTDVAVEVSRSPLFWLPESLVQRMEVLGEAQPVIDETRLANNLLAVKERGKVSTLAQFGPLPHPDEDDEEWAVRFGVAVDFDDEFSDHLKALSNELGVDLLSGVVSWEQHPERYETDEEWAMRIALVMQESGLYDPDTGWIDVYAAHGIDMGDPMTRLDFEAWADGASSYAFDQISLDRWLAQYDDDYTWAQEVIAAQGQAVVGRAIALLAREAVIEFIGLTPQNLADADDPLDTDDAVDYALTVAQVTWGMLYRVEPEGLDTGDALFSRVIETLQGQPDYATLLETILPPVVEWLLEVQNHWWKWYELLDDPEQFIEDQPDETAEVEGQTP